MTQSNSSQQTRRRGPMGGHMGGPMGQMGGSFEKPKSFKKTLQTFLKYLSPYKWQLIFVFVFAIASTIFSIIGPKLLGKATTKLYEGIVAKAMHVPGATVDFSYISHIALVLIILYVVSSIFGYIQGYIMSNIAMKVTYTFRRRIAEKINRMPLKYFDSKTHGEVLSRVTNDIDTVSATLTQNLSQIVTSVTMILGILVMMLSISVWMTLIALLVIPISLVLVTVVVKASQKYFKKQQEYLGHVNGHVEEMYGGHVIMKAFNGEKKAVEQFDKLNNELYGANWKSQFLSSMMFPTMLFVGNLAYVGVSILGGYLAVRGSIGVGDILAFIQYVRSFTQPIAQTANIANVLQSTAAAAERVFEFLDEPEETPDTANPVKLTTTKGDVSFHNVRFGYSPDKVIIHDFSADIHPGEKVAIVGPTGAGKTTIVKLLERFYDIDAGSITIDGVDIRKFTREDLRAMFGMVLQDTWLFNGTIRDNIRYGKLDATDEEVTAAAKMANVDHFVRTLPQGYDMELNEESTNISQGQKQLLTIARAFLANPKILILDEATSSVDTRTEVLIQKAMQDLMKNRTSFVIAHRLSTIRDADVILVMKDGDIVEQGNHEQLLAANGFYASLYKSQFEAITDNSVT
ncbi:MAG TPA: ABC transporter ATP-binding protein [Dehalococcoidales bacterium]|nr:ABC transporter ATP-binding protein [Dehalococcoidales bacterium]